VVDNGEELIQGGLCFIEQVPGVGRRIVRNVTTHLTSNNTAYTEASVNEAVNYAVYELRAALEPIVGRRGNLTNVLAAKAAAAAKLAQLVNEGVITNWRALSLELVVDVLQVSVEIAPVIPINFIQTTVYLNTLPISAT
jgi:prophage DNA circulation protein